jgi:polar amino acid transport system permease protein
MAVDATGAGSEVRPPKVRPVDQPGRLSFRTKVALVWVGIFVLLGILFSLADFDVGWMRDNAVFILKGLWVTLFIAFFSIVLACILALFGALGRLSKNPIAYGVSGFYTSFFRGTPLIVQLFLVYLAIPQVAAGLNLPASIYKYTVLSAVFVGVLVLGFNYGAYMTEIFRAGILSVGHGQAEAADALGMTYRQQMRRVVLPQAFKVVIPPTANEFIAMTKDTALLGFLGAPVFWWDIFQRARIQGNADFRNLEALLLAAAVYWILTIILTFFQAKLERKVGRGFVREEVATRKSRWFGGAGGLAHGRVVVEVPIPPEEEQT